MTRNGAQTRPLSMVVISEPSAAGGAGGAGHDA